jgi:hypothetical protein
MTRPRDPTQFTRESAERIANVVRAAELASPAARPLSFDPLVDGRKPKVFRMATFTGSWPMGGQKTVTFKNQTATPNTASVVNLFCGLSPSGSCDASIAKEGTAWYLVQPNLSQQPGYSSSGTQVLTIVNGSLTWIGTTACTAA